MNTGVNNKRVFFVAPHRPLGFAEMLGKRDDVRLDMLEQKTPDPAALEILEDETLTPELGAQCDRLRKTGFRIALDDVNHLTPEIESFLKHVDIVKLDWPYLDPKTAQDTVRKCRRAGKIVLRKSNGVLRMCRMSTAR